MWTTGVVQDFQKITEDTIKKAVVSATSLPLIKKDVHSALFIIILYHTLKGNTSHAKEYEKYLWELAKFQDLPEEDEKTIKKWTEIFVKKQHLGRMGRKLSQTEIPQKVEFTYNRYKKMVQAEMESYRLELEQLK